MDYDSRAVFHDERYRQTLVEIGSLRERFPDDALLPLAREVIRRLSDHPAADKGKVDAPTQKTINALTDALLSSDHHAASRFVDGLLAQGATVETIYLSYLARAARTLGTRWNDDTLSFTEVTVATGHIYAVMRGLEHAFRIMPPRQSQPTALFSTVPGESHSLGIQMAADLFRDDGWRITLKQDLDHDALVAFATASGHTIIGLSAGGEHSIIPLTKLIVALRVSVPEAAIMVSGNAVKEVPEMLRRVGADIVPTEFDEALRRARLIWNEKVRSA